MEADRGALRIADDRDPAGLSDVHYVDVNGGAERLCFLQSGLDVGDGDVVEPVGRDSLPGRGHDAAEHPVADLEHRVFHVGHGKLLGLPAEEPGVELEGGPGVGCDQLVPLDGVWGGTFVFGLGGLAHDLNFVAPGLSGCRQPFNENVTLHGGRNGRRFVWTFAHLKTRSFAVFLAASLAVVPSRGQTKKGAPLFDDLGDHHHAITTQSKEAQRYFDQGVALMYAFNHGEAIRSFEEAARLDPDAAMPHWAIALALGPNINAPMEKEAGPEAWAALKKARKLAGKGSKVEQALIDALSKRYAEDAPEDRAKLDLAYAEAMREVARKFPDDPDAPVLFAEALMDTMPWNYWTEEKKPRAGTAEALGALESVLKRDPSHPGANHLYIHMVEAGPTPENGLAAAWRLEDLVPEAGHLVHMPSHIYLKVGLYHRASAINERAVAADQAYIAACRAQGFYPAIYYPHNIHFLWYARAMEGRSGDALDAARDVSAYVTLCRPDALEKPRQNPLPILTLVRFERWDDALKEPQPEKSGLFEKALVHFARGMAHAGKGQMEDAERESAELEKIAASREAEALDSPYLPATSVLKVATHELAGAMAKARGDVKGMIREYEAAVAAQDELPYMEPPFYHYPVRQKFGAALLAVGRPVEAEAVFRADLERVPHNGWSLHGLSRSLAAQGKTAEAETYGKRFEEAWVHADVELPLSPEEPMAKR